MKHNRFEITSEQTLRLAELRDILAKAVSNQTIKIAEFPIAQQTCIDCNNAGCLGTCYILCNAYCQNSCSVYCRGSCSYCGGSPVQSAPMQNPG